MLLTFFTVMVSAQETTGTDTLNTKTLSVLPVTIRNGDTMPLITMKEVQILAPPKFTSRKHYRQYTRLTRYVKKVYPYAKFVKLKLDEVDDDLALITDEHEQRKYIRDLQDELMENFENDIRHMTFTQGKILLKLIDRETGASSYIWLKEYKGTFFAGFWQTVARIFGSNLKMEYDPAGEDAMIEQIVLMIDAGVI